MTQCSLSSRPTAVQTALSAVFLLAPLVGCDAVRQLALQTAPKTEKVAAEFSRLPGKKVLVFVWVPPEVKWDYPHVRLDLAAHVGGYLKQNVKNVTIVDPYQVEASLNKSSRVEADPVEVGRSFQSDVVVALAVYQFSVRDPGMAHYYRGRIAASVEVHELTGKDSQRIPLHEVRVAYPDEKAIGFANVRADQVRQATCEMFATEVGRKFHSWDRPLD
ncbi:MAG TPA: hypothetical protein VLM89_12240 [Phycisphaerae bacterium]|nr:hypothetical protein [Phycisphaerae bacterium]